MSHETVIAFAVAVLAVMVGIFLMDALSGATTPTA